MNFMRQINWILRWNRKSFNFKNKSKSYCNEFTTWEETKLIAQTKEAKMMIMKRILTSIPKPEMQKDSPKTKVHNLRISSVLLTKDLCLKFSRLWGSLKVFLKRKLRKDKWVWNISKKLSMRWSAFRKIYDLLSFFLFYHQYIWKKKSV